MSNHPTPGHCPVCGANGVDGEQGCFNLCATIYAREYSNPAFGAVHQLSVAAHALQHPEERSNKANVYHLLSLCWLLEFGGETAIGQEPRWLGAAFNGQPDLPTLAPPPPTERGAITVADVAGAASAADHAARVRQWALAVWDAWAAHHSWARLWISERGYAPQDEG